MAKIKVNDIKVNDTKLAGVNLFEDAESFINDIEDNEFQVLGGLQLQAACGDECRCTYA